MPTRGILYTHLDSILTSDNSMAQCIVNQVQSWIIHQPSSYVLRSSNLKGKLLFVLILGGKVDLFLKGVGNVVAVCLGIKI